MFSVTFTKSKSTQFRLTYFLHIHKIPNTHCVFDFNHLTYFENLVKQSSIKKKNGKNLKLRVDILNKLQTVQLYRPFYTKWYDLAWISFSHVYILMRMILDVRFNGKFKEKKLINNELYSYNYHLIEKFCVLVITIEEGVASFIAIVY